MDTGERLRYPLEETMDTLCSMLKAVVPHINAELKACTQMPWVNLQVAELPPSATAQPRPLS